MRAGDIVVAALDLLLLFIILIFLGFMAVRYDANKGIGERNYVQVYNLLYKTRDHFQDNHPVIFQPLILDGRSLHLLRYELGEARQLGTFASVSDLVNSGKLKQSLPCVIYERERSPFFPEVLRYLALKKIPIGLAQVAEKSTSNDTTR